MEVGKGLAFESLEDVEPAPIVLWCLVSHISVHGGYGIADGKCTITHDGMRDNSSSLSDPRKQLLNRLTEDTAHEVNIVQ